MKKVLVAMLAAVLFFGAAFAEEAANPRQNPDTAIIEAIRLLEAKDYVNMVNNFVPPEDLKKVLSEITLIEFAQQFGQHGAPRMLNVLKGIKGVKPDTVAEGKLIYKVPENIDKDIRNVLLIKVDGLWYITN